MTMLKSPNDVSTHLKFKMIDNEPRLDSVQMAQSLEIKNSSLVKTIRKYENDLKELGEVYYELKPLITKGGIQNTVIASLNEDQALFMSMLSRNTRKNIEFKKDLTSAIAILRKQINKEKGFLSQDIVMGLIQDMSRINKKIDEIDQTQIETYKLIYHSLNKKQ